MYLLHDYIRTLVWPAAAVFFVLLFRKHIMRLLDSLSSLKYGDAEARFEKNVRAAEDLADDGQFIGAKPATEPVRDEALTGHRRDIVSRLAEVSPRGAVLESWVAVESALEDASRNLGIESRRGKLGSPAIHALQQNGVLSNLWLGLYRDLRAIRNDAVHMPDFAITTDAAKRFASLADSLSEAVISAASSSKSGPATSRIK